MSSFDKHNGAIFYQHSNHFTVILFQIFFFFTLLMGVITEEAYQIVRSSLCDNFLEMW